LLRRTLKAAAVLSSIALALVAITPTLLSHPSGLSTALHVINATVPAVTIEIDSLNAGWRRPLEIHGVKIFEKTNNKIATKKSTIDSKRTLLEVQKIKSTASLVDLALRGCPSDVIVAGPRVNVTINDQGNLRILQALQDAGVAPLPRQNGKQEDKDGETRQQEATILFSTDDAAKFKADTMASSSSLQQISASIPFSGEIRAGNMHVAFTSGQFLAPTEFRELFVHMKKDISAKSLADFGMQNTAPAVEVPEIHFEVLMGGETIEEEAKIEEQQAGFVNTVGENLEKKEEEEESSLADWARQKPSVQLPPDVGKAILKKKKNVYSPVPVSVFRLQPSKYYSIINFLDTIFFCFFRISHFSYGGEGGLSCIRV
jgi:hypothetical protein